MKAPATLDEFYRRFPTERRCWEALRRMRWPDSFRYPVRKDLMVVLEARSE